jgi:hypothetical protein
VIYSVRVELEVTIGPGEHVVSYADRLQGRLREQEGGTIQRARSLFHTRRGPHHGVARVTVAVQESNQGKAASAALRALRAAAAGDAKAWDIARARVIVEPGR